MMPFLLTLQLLQYLLLPYHLQSQPLLPHPYTNNIPITTYIISLAFDIKLLTGSLETLKNKFPQIEEPKSNKNPKGLFHPDPHTSSDSLRSIHTDLDHNVSRTTDPGL